MLGSADGGFFLSGLYTLATQPVEYLPQFAARDLARRGLQSAWLALLLSSGTLFLLSYTPGLSSLKQCVIDRKAPIRDARRQHQGYQIIVLMSTVYVDN